MLTKAYSRKLVDRLCTLPSANNDMFDSQADAKIAVRSELSRAIDRFCVSDEHAALVIESLMDGRFRPSPGEIRDAAAGAVQARSLPDGCEMCVGQPWITVDKIISDRFTGAKDENGRPLVVKLARMGSKRCDCTKGQWFQQKDRENKIKRDAGLLV